MAPPRADALVPEAVEPLLCGRLGRPYLYRERCESTQLLLEPAMPEGTTAVCEEQLAGRGRLGRAWHAPARRAILCSVLLRPPEERRLAELSLVGGVAVADTVEQALGLSAQIKWPNDVMVNRFKVAGVLGELRAGGVVLGIGINVNQTRSELPSEAPPPAGSLRTIDGVTRERAPLVAELLDRLERAYERWLEGGLDALYVSLGPRDFLRGRIVAVDGARGLAVGIDRSGRLEVDIGGERRFVDSGHVSYEQ